MCFGNMKYLKNNNRKKLKKHSYLTVWAFAQTVIIFITVMLVSACQQNNMFKDFLQDEKVIIALNEYELDCIPKEIGTLKNTKELVISMNNFDYWTIYPPQSAMEYWINSPPFTAIPTELLKLSKLEKLTLIGLNIKTLPEGIDQLENLEYLNLSFNKLNITDELPKLIKLPKLNHIVLIGNKVNMNHIKKWRIENPAIHIEVSNSETF